MQASSVTYFAQQIGYQVPTLLGGLLGVILSIVFIGRQRLPASLALLGSITAIVGALVVAIAQSYLFSARNTFTGVPSSYLQLSMIIGWLGAISRGLAIALLVVAVFVGRKRETVQAT